MPESTEYSKKIHQIIIKGSQFPGNSSFSPLRHTVMINSQRLGGSHPRKPHEEAGSSEFSAVSGLGGDKQGS